MPEKVRTIIQAVETLAHRHYAVSWDNVGLQVGGMDEKVEKVLICLDITEEVLNEAVEKGVQLIITHHPLIFSPLKNIIKEDYKGNIIYKAIQNKINLYAVHTNIDIAPGGLNDFVANKLNLYNIDVFDVTLEEVYYKLAVFVPDEHVERVADALASAGAGHIGNYSHCTYRVEGIGTFKPLEGANPFTGSRGNLEKIKEIRLETIFSADKMEQVISNMLSAHPYEEAAYDIYPLKNEGEKKGLGRKGRLPESMPLKKIAEQLKNLLNIEKLKVTGDIDKVIENVIIVTGSGANYIEKAAEAGCDCFITGDVKYHQAQTALEQGICVIDAGHFESEAVFLELMKDYLKGKGLNIEVITSESQHNPFQIL